MPNRPGIASMSLGHPAVHDLPSKLHAAAAYGFKGVELFYEDLTCLASDKFQGDIFAATQAVRVLCNRLSIEIICLQPFSFYDGLLDRARTEELVNEKLSLWFMLCPILNTDLIQVPANFLGPDPETKAPRTTGDMSVIVSDLQCIADLGAIQKPRPIRFAYEALCWSDHIDTWEASWEIVQRVDRPNFGICLDTFNIAGRIYADPACPTGKTPNAEVAIKKSIARLRATVDVKKIFYVQIVDAERLDSPLDESHPFHVEGQPTRMNWSRNARLFAFEEDRGGYLPILDVAKAFFDVGFEGWVSLELFSRTLLEKNINVPSHHAIRGIESWKKLVKSLKLKTVEDEKTLWQMPMITFKTRFPYQEIVSSVYSYSL